MRFFSNLDGRKVDLFSPVGMKMSTMTVGPPSDSRRSLVVQIGANGGPAAAEVASDG